MSSKRSSSAAVKRNSSGQRPSKSQESQEQKESPKNQGVEKEIIPAVTKVEFRPDGSGMAVIEWGPSRESSRKRLCCRKKSSGRVKGEKGKSGGGIKAGHWSYSRITEDRETGYKTYEVFGKHKRRPCFRVPAGVDKVFITHPEGSTEATKNQKASPSGSGGNVKWNEENLESYKQIESDTEGSASDASTGHNTELGPASTGSEDDDARPAKKTPRVGQKDTVDSASSSRVVTKSPSQPRKYSSDRSRSK